MKKKLFVLLAGAAMLFTACNKPTEPSHTHSLTRHAAVASTCTTKGTIEYWDCTECKKKFSDENATKEITEVEAPLADHNYQHKDKVEPTETDFGMEEHYECSVCSGLAIKEGDNYVVKTAEELKIAKLVYYDVTFNFAGIPAQRVKAGELVEEPKKPKLEDDNRYTYEFIEWQKGGETYDFSDPVESSFTLEPVFDATPIDYTITFTFEGELDEPVAKKFNCETDPSTFEEPTVTPDDGYHVVWTPAYDLTKLENQSITGSFAPNTDTPYKVEHYFPKLDGTGFEVYKTEDKTGTTGDNTAAEALTLGAFKAQTFNQSTIAGDGTTVVKIYYDRGEMALAKDNDTQETDIETVTDFGANVQKVTLSTNQYGIAWTSLVPNFTKDELDKADGIEFVVKLPAQGTMMCSNTNQFAKDIAGGDFRVVRLTKDAMLSDYHGKKTIDDIYNHMIYPGSRGMGFLFSSLTEQEVSIELLSANLYTGELNPLANAVLNKNLQTANFNINSAFINSSNISKFDDAPDLPNGASGMVRILSDVDNSGSTHLRFNPTGLFTKEELLAAGEITLKIYAVPYVTEGTMTFNAYLNNVHFQKDNAVGQWIDVKVPTSLIGVQENCPSLSAAYDSMIGGWVTVPKLQFKLNGSGYTGGKVAFYFAGMGKFYEKISTLVNVKVDNYDSNPANRELKTLTYIDSENITSTDPELPNGKTAMMKVEVTPNQWGVSRLRLDPTNFFTEDELKIAQTIDLLVYFVKNDNDRTTFNPTVQNVHFNDNLATNTWLTINIPVQLFWTQGKTDGTHATWDNIINGWVNFVEFAYTAGVKQTYYIGGVSLINHSIDSNNYTKVGYYDGTNPNFTNTTYINGSNKGENDPVIPDGYSGYAKISGTTNQFGLCDIRFDNGILNNKNIVWGTTISFKLYCTCENVDDTVALSMNNDHNYGSKSSKEWIDFEYPLVDRGALGSDDRLKQNGATVDNWKWVEVCRVLFKVNGAALNKGNCTIYIADVIVK